MIRRILGLLAATSLVVWSAGCDGASSTAAKKDPIKDIKDGAKELAKDAKDGAKELAKDAKDAGKSVVDAGKEQLAKLSDISTKEFPAIETKINGLSGDAKTKATEAFTALKKMFEDAKASVSDPTKWKAALEAITTKLAELKKQVGLS